MFLVEGSRPLVSRAWGWSPSHILAEPPLHLHRSIFCDDVTTRSVAGRKPALHCPQDPPLFPVSDTCFFCFHEWSLYLPDLIPSCTLIFCSPFAPATRAPLSGNQKLPGLPGMRNAGLSIMKVGMVWV